MLVFVEGLLKKENSDTFKEVHGEIAEFPVQVQILAHLLNAVRILDYHFVCANTDQEKNGKVQQPELLRLTQPPDCTPEEDEDAAYKRWKTDLESVPVGISERVS